MKEPWLHKVVPTQQSGQSSFTMSRINCRNASHAMACYRIAAERLVNVNRWNEYTGEAIATFQLFDRTGNAINRQVQKNDYLRINISGHCNPESTADWAQVLQLGEKSIGEQQLIFMTVASCSNPLTANTGASHFFDHSATLTFVIFRQQLTIMAAVFGRNEHLNKKSQHLFSRIRNWFVYMGTQLGFSNLQWKPLTHGLLHEKEH